MAAVIERQIYEDWYEIFYPDRRNPFVCFYCGMPADTMDHCPPISRINDYRAFELAREQYLKVPCCRQCNSILGDSLQETIVERDMSLTYALERKFNKLLDMPDWTEEQIKEMGRNVRSYIERKMKERRQIMARIDYCEGINAYLAEMESQKFDDFDVEDVAS